jgi:hypothetical protein
MRNLYSLPEFRLGIALPLRGIGMTRSKVSE